MDTKSGTMDCWREFFRSANSDIFKVIEYAIMIAALDYPEEFRIRRDRIAEKLFSSRLTRCVGCDHVELVVPEEENGGKECKVNTSCTSDPTVEMNRAVSNYSYDEAEALTEEIGEEGQIVREVLRIKDVLSNNLDESDDVLFESLRRLQLMELTVLTLKATEIGKAVKGLRKHGLKQIRHLARALIEGWKDVVDEWVNAATAIADGTPESVDPSVGDEEGLPSPPLDEVALFSTQTTSIELSEFFDGMDDDGNPRNCGEFDKNGENSRKPISENNIPMRKRQPLHQSNVPKEDNSPVRKHEAINKQAERSGAYSGQGRPPKLKFEDKADGDIKFLRRLDPDGIQKKRQTSNHDQSKCSNDATVQVKLEAAKRKLHEGYQQAENAKKQRTIQVMELHDLPKQGGPIDRNPHWKQGNQNRHWANGRH